MATPTQKRLNRTVEEINPLLDKLDEDYTKEQIDEKFSAIAGGIHYKGEVNYYSDLPNDAEVGDAYTVKYAGSSGSTLDGSEYVWGAVSGVYQWIDFSKETYTKAEVTALLALKQDTIDSSHKLSSDLVDDENATHKFATEAQLEQIETNKNNILLNRHYGVKNIFVPTTGTTTNPTGFTGTITRNADNSYTINGSTGGDVYYLLLGRIKMPVGTFVLYARPTNKTGIFVYNDGDWADNDDSRYKTFSQPSSQGIFLRIAANQTLENYTIYPMICDRTAWSMSRDYEIGALSNAELTAAEKQNENNILTYAIPTCTDTAFTTSTTGAYVYTGISFTVPSGEVWEFFVADKYNGSGTTNFSAGLLVSDSSSAITNVSVIAENTQVPSVSGISYWVRQLTGLTPKRANATTYYVWTNRAVTTSCNIFLCLRRVF